MMTLYRTAWRWMVYHTAWWPCLRRDSSHMTCEALRVRRLCERRAFHRGVIERTEKEIRGLERRLRNLERGLADQRTAEAELTRKIVESVRDQDRAAQNYEV